MLIHHDILILTIANIHNGHNNTMFFLLYVYKLSRLYIFRKCQTNIKQVDKTYQVSLLD